MYANQWYKPINKSMGMSTLELSTNDPTSYSYIIFSQILIDCSLLNQKYDTDKLIGARKYWEDHVIHSLTIIMHRFDFGLFSLFITKTYSFSFCSIDGVASAFHFTCFRQVLPNVSINSHFWIALGFGPDSAYMRTLEQIYKWPIFEQSDDTWPQTWQ